MKLPAKGMAKDALFARLDAARAADADWRGGKTWSLVYHAGAEVLEVIREAYASFIMENALSPVAFPSLRRMENEVIGIAADLLHGPETAAGSLTTGGTESILMAVKAARDRARALRPWIREPELIVPATAHPAFLKAAHYLGVRATRIPVRADFRADPEATRAAIGDDTVLAVGSAPAYPQGVIDPIADLAAIAAERGVPFHVDACLGGFLLPFAERLGHAVPPFDFRVPGVTSMSADIHKYGYAAKGASVVLYRDAALRKHQFYSFAEWPGGLYVSPTMTGSRPGGAIAAAWAVLHYLGEEGYLGLARGVLDTTRRLIDGVRAIPGLRVLGEPDMSVFAFASDAAPPEAIGQAMEACGWRLDVQQLPASLHLMVTPSHAAVVPEFLGDLRDAARAAEAAGATHAMHGTAAIYGMLAAMPDRSGVPELMLDFLDGIYRPERAACGERE